MKLYPPIPATTAFAIILSLSLIAQCVADTYIVQRAPGFQSPTPVLPAVFDCTRFGDYNHCAIIEPFQLPDTVLNPYPTTGKGLFDGLENPPPSMLRDYSE
jgi:hypothetical protein